MMLLLLLVQYMLCFVMLFVRFLPECQVLMTI